MFSDLLRWVGSSIGSFHSVHHDHYNLSERRRNLSKLVSLGRRIASPSKTEFPIWSHLARDLNGADCRYVPFGLLPRSSSLRRSFPTSVIDG